MPKAIRLVGVLTIICVVSALSLSYVFNEIAGPIIDEREKEAAVGMLRDLVPDADDFEIVTDDNDRIIYYEIIKGGRVAYVAIPIESSGFGGPVRLILVADMDGNIEAVSVLNHSETPGYGDRIETEPEFLEQYISKNLIESSFTMGTDITALAGATVTSDAANRAVQRGAEYFMLNFMEGMEDELLEREREEIFAILNEVRPDADEFGYEIEGGQHLYYTIMKEGNVVSYALVSEGRGLNGPVQLLTIVDEDGVIEEIAVVSIVDTPGYGDRVETEPEFLDQFKGMSLTDDRFEIDDTIDKIVGATITSMGAAESIRNAASKWIELFIEGSAAAKPSEEDDPDKIAILREYFSEEYTFENCPAGSGALYAAILDNEVRTYAIFSSKRGLQSDIEVLLFADLTGIIKNVVILSQNDTPSYGDRILEEDWFTDQYIGKSLNESVFNPGDDIDVLSGATVTSTAANDAVIASADTFKSCIQKGAGQ